MKKILLLAVLLPFSLFAQTILDNSFGNDGKIITTVQNEQSRAQVIVPLPEGSILVGGNSYDFIDGVAANQSAFISKFTADGNADISFGTNGTVYFPIGASGISWIYDLKLQPDGKVLVASRVNGNHELRRLTPNGSLDTNFANAGVAQIDNYGRIGLLADGKIMVSGQYYNGSTLSHTLRRFNTDGSIDSTFGTNGSIFVNGATYPYDVALQIVILPDGRFITIGNAFISNHKAVISRFNANGSPDTTFGTNGMVLAHLGDEPGDGYFSDLAVQPDGKIVTCGYATATNGTGTRAPIVACYNINGTPDASFGNNGLKILPAVYNASDELNCLKLQPNGKILAAGSASYPYPYMVTHFYLLRLNADGSTDTTFAENGRYTADFTSVTDEIHNSVADIELQADGKILTAGTSGSVSPMSLKMLVCRLTPTVNSTDIFNPDSLTVFPNPATNTLYINNYTGGDIKVFNLNGQLVQEIKNNTFTGSVSISELQTGVYFISVTDGAHKTVKKFVKV